MIILAMDGLEIKYVESFECEHLKQEVFGKTDISDFKEPRTIVLWASFLTGKNMEERVLSSKDLWSFRVNVKETFFSKFKRYKAIDVPAFTYELNIHQREREMLKKYFEKSIDVNKYDKVALENHRKIKKQFLESLNENYEILMCYFAIADVIGHLSFGLKSKMRLVYKELDEIAKIAREADKKVLIISDHGMKPIGRFGDHSNYGFWSLSIKKPLQKPKLTAFRRIIENL